MVKRNSTTSVGGQVPPEKRKEAFESWTIAYEKKSILSETWKNPSENRKIASERRSI